LGLHWKLQLDELQLELKLMLMMMMEQLKHPTTISRLSQIFVMFFK